jgi:3'(2'), 5'-bisphosphate nucleotidase
MGYEKELEVALDAVAQASKLCQAVQQRLVAGSTLQKGDKSPVTVADFGAQAIVSHLLHQAFPSIPLVGEEDADALRESGNQMLRDNVLAGVQSVRPELGLNATLDAIDRGTFEGGKSGRHWTLDPIDGTKGFLRLDQYAVALALIEDGEVVLGVLGCPNMPPQSGTQKGALFSAVRGQGANQHGLIDLSATPIHVDDVTDASMAKFCESVETAHTSHSHSARIGARLGITAPPYRIDSQCKYAAVARGDASIYLRLPTKPGYVEKIWDHAAGWAVVTEAGGRVTDVSGADLDFGLGRRLESNKGVIVTNGRFHDEVLRAVQAEL